jgi:STE24 endopeptidase
MFFRFKRIVLFETLLNEEERGKLKSEEDKKKEAEEKEDKNDDKAEKSKGCDTGEILAVLGHELGHWKLNHVLKNLIISEVSE